MRLDDFRRAFEIAGDESVDLTGVPIDVFDGYGLKDFKPVVCTLRQVAALMRWEAKCMSGEWDVAALNMLRDCGKHLFEVID